MNILDLLETDFEKNMLTAANTNFSDTSNRLRLNNYAYVLRELVDVVLNRISLESEIEKCVWYKTPTKGERKYTRGHKLIYAIAGGLSLEFVETKLRIDLTKELSQINNNISKLSSFVHIREATFNIDKNKIDALKEEADNIFLGIGNQMSELRDRLHEEILESIDDQLHREVFWNGFEEIPGIGGNQSLNLIEDIEPTILVINADKLLFHINAKMTVDIERGGRRDGVVGSMSVPIFANLESQTSDPYHLILISPGIQTDADEIDKILRE